MLRNRLIFFLLWVISLVGISFYGGPLSYGFFAVMTFIPIACLIYLLIVLLRFKIYQDFESHDIVSNHKTPFYFTLQNEDRFAFCAVRVQFYSDFSVIDGLKDDTEYELLPGDKIKKETVLVCRYRGEYCVGIRSVTLRDFLCLFKITYQNHEALRVTVLPDIVSLKSLRYVDIDLASHRETAVNPSVPDVTVRDYVPGDDVRRINWKQTAKTGEAMVRNYIGEEKTGVGLIIDPSRLLEEETGYLPVENRILEIAIAVTLFMEERNIPISIYDHSSEVAVGNENEFNGFYRRMAAFSFRDDLERTSLFADLSHIRELYAKKIVFIVTGLYDDPLRMLCEELNKNDTEVFVYLVRPDITDTVFDGASHTHVITLPADRNLSELI